MKEAIVLSLHCQKVGDNIFIQTGKFCLKIKNVIRLNRWGDSGHSFIVLKLGPYSFKIKARQLSGTASALLVSRVTFLSWYIFLYALVYVSGLWFKYTKPSLPWEKELSEGMKASGGRCVFKSWKGQISKVVFFLLNSEVSV